MSLDADYITGIEYIPLSNLPSSKDGKIEICLKDSLKPYNLDGHSV
jgi:hypothetical protein